MNRRVRLLAWFILRGAAVLQVCGMVAIAFGVGFLFGWPVGLIVFGFEAVLLGVVLEMRPNARTST